MTRATPLIEAIARVLRDADHGCDWQTYVTDAKAALTAITEAGYAVVPVEPTEAMCEHGRVAMGAALIRSESRLDRQATGYRAMISAAQGDGA